MNTHFNVVPMGALFNIIVVKFMMNEPKIKKTNIRVNSLPIVWTAMVIILVMGVHLRGLLP